MRSPPFASFGANTMFRLVITEAAHDDLDEALAYIATVLENPAAAIALTDEVETVYRAIRAHPEAHPFCDSPRLTAMGYRKAAVKNYLFVFRVDSTGKRVIVLRFFHQTQDYLGVL